MHSTRNRIVPILTFALFIGTWLLVDHLIGIRKIILPNPIEISLVIADNFPYLLYHTSITLVEAVLGFLFGSALGAITAISFAYSKLLKRSLYPYAIAFKSVPVIALAPVLVMWFGSGMVSKIVMATIIPYFPVLVGTVKGLTAVTSDHLDLFRSLHASEWHIFWKLRIPNSLPHFFPSLKVASTFAVLGATIAEFTGSSAGIGYIIVNSSYYLETTMMFAAIVMISVAGLLFFFLVEYIEKKVVFWQDH